MNRTVPDNRWQALRQRHGRTLITRVTVGALALALIVIGFNASGRSLAILSFIATAYALLPSLWAALSSQRTPPIDASDSSARLANAAAQHVRFQLERHLRDSSLLPIDWTASDGRSGTAFATTVDSAELTMTATADILAAEFRTSGRQMVVLGEPGSGKSMLALLLTLGLLRARTPDEPIPVFVPASRWNPVQETLEDLVCQYLGATYYGGDASEARLLASNPRILPIIDGLDEVPETRRRQAASRLHEHCRAGRSIGVTCRREEYEHLLRGGAPQLSDTAPLLLEPLSPSVVEGHLQRTVWPAGQDWSSVVTEVGAQELSPIRLTLTTPLNLVNATRVFLANGESPAVLTHRSVFSTRFEIEDYLSEQMLQLAEKGGEPGLPRLLRYVAEVMDATQEREFSWTTFAPRALGRSVGPAIGLLAGLLVTVVTIMIVESQSESNQLGSPGFTGGILGTLCFVLVSVTWAASGSRPPGQIRISRRGSAEGFRIGFRQGVAVTGAPVLVFLSLFAVVIILTAGWNVGSILLISQVAGPLFGVCASTGLVLGLERALDSPQVRPESTSPLDSFRKDRLATLVGSCIAAVAGGALAAPLAFAGQVATISIALAVTAWAGWPGEPNMAKLVRGTAVRDLDVLGDMPAAVLLTAALPGLVYALLILITRAWFRYLVACAVLRILANTPTRLLTTLESAKKWGLLRESGPNYQFRHARIQDYMVSLAASAGPSSMVRSQRLRALRIVGTVAAVALLAGGVFIAPRDSAGQVIALGGGGSDSADFTTSRDGRLVAVWGRASRDVSVVQADGGRRVLRVEAFGPAKDVRLSDDGSALMVDSALSDEPDAPRRVEVWRITDGSLMISEPGFTMDSEFSGDPLVTLQRSSSDSTETLLLNRNWGRVAQRLGGVELVSSSRTRIAVQTADGVVTLYDRDDGRRLSVLAALGSSRVDAFMWRDDESHLYFHGAEALHSYDATTGQPLKTWQLPRSVVATVNSEETAAAVVESEPGLVDSALLLVDLASQTSEAQTVARREFSYDGGDLRFLTNDLLTATFSAGTIDGDTTQSTMLVSSHRRAIVSELAGVTRLQMMGEPGFGVGVTGSEDEDTMKVVLVDLEKGTTRCQFPVNSNLQLDSGLPRGFRLLSDGSALILAPGSNLVSLASPATCTARQLPLPSRRRAGVLISTQSQHAIVDQGDRVTVWHLPDGAFVGELFNPDGRSILNFTDDVRIDESDSGSEDQGGGPISGAALGGQGAWLVSGQDDGSTFAVRDVTSGDIMGDLSGHDGSIGRFAVAGSSGDVIISAGAQDGTVRLWAAPASIGRK